ncbi:hypothetical protein KY290_015850 [Solanum tuberosum]|uniref:Tetratricopeptide repeat protein 5 OB fold domain-containing protein n=1 Tax=Solanum tuberosum TaxID=4113 RepID=A0ABQ7VVT1_SOLTU|nr:hypothetical protein KY290_015850 [Solanum tuberosum]
MSTPTEEVSIDLKSSIEEVSTRLEDLKSTIVSTHLKHLKSTTEQVSTHLKDLQSAIEEVSTHQKDLQSAIEEVSTHLNESNPSLKMSTPTEEVSREKEEVSTDLKSTIEEHFSSTTQQREISEIEHQIDLCIEVLDSIPQEKRELNHEHAMFEYLKGRFYNAIPDVYKKEAEHHLQNATESKSLWLEAWDCLGLCLSKKGDYHGARECYKLVLKLGKENRGALRRMADLELKIALVYENPAPHLKKCIKYAEKTLALDCMDGGCLYTLGRAYMKCFSVSKGMDHDKLQLALEAFKKAKKIPTEKSNAQLEIHCSVVIIGQGCTGNFTEKKKVVNRYLENYKMSLNGFSDAESMDPASDALHEKQVTIQLLDKFQGLLQGKRNDKNKGKNKGKSQGKNKRKRNGMDGRCLFEVMCFLAVNPQYNRATVNLLTEGPNKWIAVVAEVQCLVEYEYQAPLYYMLCDSDENSFVLTVFNIKEKAIKQGDQVTLLDPICKFVDFEWEGKHYQFKSVRVNLLEQVLVNGNALPNSAIPEPISYP